MGAGGAADCAQAERAKEAHIIILDATRINVFPVNQVPGVSEPVSPSRRSGLALLTVA